MSKEYIDTLFDVEKDEETIRAGEKLLHSTLTALRKIDPAYGFILYRFNRIAISHKHVDTVIFLDRNLTPTIGINYERFAELGALARASCIEHCVGHLLCGHLGYRLGKKLKDYCMYKYGPYVGAGPGIIRRLHMRQCLQLSRKTCSREL